MKQKNESAEVKMPGILGAATMLGGMYAASKLGSKFLDPTTKKIEDKQNKKVDREVIKRADPSKMGSSAISPMDKTIAKIKSLKKEKPPVSEGVVDKAVKAAGGAIKAGAKKAGEWASHNISPKSVVHYFKHTPGGAKKVVGNLAKATGGMALFQVGTSAANIQGKRREYKTAMDLAYKDIAKKHGDEAAKSSLDALKKNGIPKKAEQAAIERQEAAPVTPQKRKRDVAKEKAKEVGKAAVHRAGEEAKFSAGYYGKQAAKLGTGLGILYAAKKIGSKGK